MLLNLGWVNIPISQGKIPLLHLLNTIFQHCAMELVIFVTAWLLGAVILCHCPASRHSIVQHMATQRKDYKVRFLLSYELRLTSTGPWTCRLQQKCLWLPLVSQLHLFINKAAAFSFLLSGQMSPSAKCLWFSVSSAQPLHEAESQYPAYMLVSWELAFITSKILHNTKTF